MIVLAADTSTPLGSVAVRDRRGEVVREDLGSDRPHSETLLPAVLRVLEKAGHGQQDVAAIAIGTGPGAFTGLRVGLATFKAWASARKIPLVPVVSMDAVALPFLRQGEAVAVLADARKGEFYAACYPALEDMALPRRRGDILLLPLEQVPDWLSSLEEREVLLTGTGIPFLDQKGLLVSFPGHIDRAGGVPDARWILSIAEVLLPRGATVDAAALVPTYVRAPDAKKPSPETMVNWTPETGGPTDD